MSTIRIDLLRKVADHLINGKLGHEVFDFGHYNAYFHYTREVKTELAVIGNCGTNGCAIGECPIIFPEDWEFNLYGEPCLKNMNEGCMTIELTSGMQFFSITEEQYGHLFLAFNQNEDWFKTLTTDATKEEVAANILNFCNLVEKGEITNG